MLYQRSSQLFVEANEVIPGGVNDRFAGPAIRAHAGTAQVENGPSRTPQVQVLVEGVVMLVVLVRPLDEAEPCAHCLHRLVVVRLLFS